MEPMNKEELEAEIETVSAEIEEINAQLNEVKAKLGEGEDGENTENTAPDLSEEEVAELQAKEAELTEELVARQMKLKALQKQLNDVNSNDAMKQYSEEE